MTISDLKDKTILIVSHTFVKGAPQELEDFLVERKVKCLVFIGHPFSYCSKKNSFFKRYVGGELVEVGEARNCNLPEIVIYIKDVLYTIVWVFNFRLKFDVMFGVDNLNAFSCLILKLLGKGKKVVYYTIDYVPKRFENKLLNRIYHFLDSVCVKRADFVWNVCGRMIEGREKKGVSPEFRKKQITVPIGINFRKINRLSHTEIDRKRVIFLGHLIEKQGAQLLIEAASVIITAIPDVRFKIIGGGEYESYLKKLAGDLHVMEFFEFTGLITERDIIDKELMKGAIGVAPYVPFADNFTYYADPTKPKDYMAFGLPVIITDVPYIAQVIEKRKAGFVIDYDSKILAKKIIALLKDDSLYHEYRKNAVAFAHEYDWSSIFSKALQSL